MPIAAPTSLSQFFAGLLVVVETDAEKDLLPPIVTYMQLVETKPGLTVLVAQGLALQAQLQAALPGLGQDIVGDETPAILAFVQALVSKSIAQATAATGRVA